MKQFQLFPAEVVDNDDTDQRGRVQIKIEHLMDNVEDADLPWASDFKNFIGGSDSYGISSIPETDSKLWVFFMDDTFTRECYYIADMKVDASSNVHKKFESEVKGKVGSGGSYPNMKFLYAPNGVCLAICTASSTPEIILYNPAGGKDSYVYLDSSGNIELTNNSGTMTLKSTGQLDVNGHWTVDP